MPNILALELYLLSLYHLQNGEKPRCKMYMCMYGMMYVVVPVIARANLVLGVLLPLNAALGLGDSRVTSRVKRQENQPLVQRTPKSDAVSPNSLVQSACIWAC